MATAITATGTGTMAAMIAAAGAGTIPISLTVLIVRIAPIGRIARTIRTIRTAPIGRIVPTVRIGPTVRRDRTSAVPSCSRATTVLASSPARARSRAGRAGGGGSRDGSSLGTSRGPSRVVRSPGTTPRAINRPRAPIRRGATRPRRRRAMSPRSGVASREAFKLKPDAPDRSPTRSGALVFLPFHLLRGSLLALLLVSSALIAQTQNPALRAAQTITPGDIKRLIRIIADDSMKGRDTPSPELDKVANYIAGEYRRLGLKPAGDRGTFIQRYAIDRVRVVSDSSTAFVHGGPGAALKYGTDFILADNMFENGDYAGDLVLVSGPRAGATADTAARAGKMVILATGRLRGADRDRVFGWKPAAVVFVNNAPDSVWSRVTSRLSGPTLRDPGRTVGGPLTLVIRSTALGPVLSALGVDYAAAQGATTFSVKPLSGAQLHVHARLEAVDKSSAPNVVAILEGSDPTLKNEYVVFSAHMDQ